MRRLTQLHRSLIINDHCLSAFQPRSAVQDNIKRCVSTHRVSSAFFALKQDSLEDAGQSHTCVSFIELIDHSKCFFFFTWTKRLDNQLPDVSVQNYSISDNAHFVHADIDHLGRFVLICISRHFGLLAKQYLSQPHSSSLCAPFIPGKYIWSSQLTQFLLLVQLYQAAGSWDGYSQHNPLGFELWHLWASHKPGWLP